MYNLYTITVFWCGLAFRSVWLMHILNGSLLLSIFYNLYVYCCSRPTCLCLFHIRIQLMNWVSFSHSYSVNELSIFTIVCTVDNLVLSYWCLFAICCRYDTRTLVSAAVSSVRGWLHLQDHWWTYSWGEPSLTLISLLGHASVTNTVVWVCVCLCFMDRK